MALKHVGRINSNKRKVVVAYRVLPNDPDYCLIVQTENLDASEHDALMTAVESSAGQEAYEFGEAMARAYLPDGRNMLAGFHTTGKLRRVETKLVDMTPDRNTTVNLAELNSLIAEQRGVSIEDLALKGDAPAQEAAKTDDTLDVEVTELATAGPIEAPQDGVLSDEELAAKYRSDADRLFKEAQALRKQAEELVPTKKKAKVKTEESA
jgi:hypothetical protein